jgi:UDP-N-acetylmuramyl pentapeptide synthase
MAKTFIIFVCTVLARIALLIHRPRVVAITGSVGKTSTKDAIATALSVSHTVRKSAKSFNSEIGIPLSVLGLDNAWHSVFGWMRNIIRGIKAVMLPMPEFLILEVGADHPGDISRVAYWIRPHITVLTRFPDVPVHVEFFDSPEAVANEKRHLRRALRPDGILAVNADDPLLMKEPCSKGQRRVSFGSTTNATVRLESSAITYTEDGRPSGMQLRIAIGGASIPLTQNGSLGTGSVQSILAALAVAHAIGDNVIDAARALERKDPTPGRMRIIPGRAGSTIIDDTYNASPIAAEALLTALCAIDTSGKKIFAIADMKELGDFATRMHHELGERIAKAWRTNGITHLCTVGDLGKIVATAASEFGMPNEFILHCATSQELAALLVSHVADRDVVAIKGSQSMRMERAVVALMADPELAPQLVVRQEREWITRP